MRPGRFASFLFAGVDAKLLLRPDAALPRDVVGRVQVALAHLSGRAIAPPERRAERLGPSTRAAIRRFRRQNRSLPASAATWRVVSALDAAMLAQQVEPRPRARRSLCPCCATRRLSLTTGSSAKRERD